MSSLNWKWVWNQGEYNVCLTTRLSERQLTVETLPMMRTVWSTYCSRRAELMRGVGFSIAAAGRKRAGGKETRE